MLQARGAHAGRTAAGTRTQDAAAIADMKAAWIGCRTAYEHIEGALAPIFPDIDAAIDARYDDFLAALPERRQRSLRRHGRHRDARHRAHPLLRRDAGARRRASSRRCPATSPPRFPATAQEAATSRPSCAKLDRRRAVAAEQLGARPRRIDLGAAFQGLVSLMNEQREKVNKAATQRGGVALLAATMADLRDNLAGTERVYALFQPWIQSKAAATLDGGAAGTRRRAGRQGDRRRHRGRLRQAAGALRLGQRRRHPAAAGHLEQREPDHRRPGDAVRDALRGRASGGRSESGRDRSSPR